MRSRMKLCQHAGKYVIDGQQVGQLAKRGWIDRF